MCARVGWHGNSEQEAGRSLIAICQAECQDRDGKKKSTSKERGISFSLLWAEPQPDSPALSPPWGKRNLTSRLCSGQAVSLSCQPEEGRCKRAALSPPDPCLPALMAHGQCGRWFFCDPETTESHIVLYPDKSGRVKDRT